MSLVESFIQKHARKELNDIRIIHEKHKDSYNKLKRQYEKTKDVYERSSKKLKQAETNVRMLGVAVRSENNLSCIVLAESYFFFFGKISFVIDYVYSC